MERQKEAEISIQSHLDALWVKLPEAEREKRIKRFAEWMEMASKESPFELSPSEVVYKTKKSSGPGGQNVNKRETGVVAKHIQTGLRADSKDGRLQIQNKETAFRALQESVVHQIDTWKQTSQEFRDTLLKR